MVNTMGKKKYLVSLVALSALALPFVYGCNSSDTAGGGRDDDSDVFVADENTAGRMELSVANNSLPLGGRSNFSVLVYDAEGRPVPNAAVFCGGEYGLVIYDPIEGIYNGTALTGVTSTAITDDYGHVSGVLGCSDTGVGSHRFWCRLGAGGAQRKFTTIKCGEGLLRNAIVAEGTVSATEASAENGVAEVTVANATADAVVFNSYKYTVADYDNAGNTFESNTLSLSSDTPVAAGEGATIAAPFTEETANGKRFYGSSVDFQGDWAGSKNVTVTLFGTDASGEEVSVTANFTVTF